MKKLILTLILFITGFSSSSYSYDVDTHVRMTYTLARTVGIGHEVALMLAMGNGWIDVSTSSTPMGDLLIGTRLRRLYHFPTARSSKVNNLDSHGRFDFDAVTKAIRNDPMGSELIMEGLKEGNLIKVSMGLHTLMDTFGHEGFPAEIGHAYAGHDPDRPWRDWEKYKEMIHVATKAMLAIREALPPEALDYEIPRQNRMWSRETNIYDSTVLADIFIKHIEPFAKIDIFSDPNFLKIATNFLLNNEKEIGLIRKEFDLKKLPLSDLMDGTKDIYEVFYEITKRLSYLETQGVQVFERKFLFNELLVGIPIDESKNIFQQVEKMEDRMRHMLIQRVVTKILEKHVPQKLGITSIGTTNMFNLEAKTPLRDVEMRFRIGRWRNFDNTYFGQEWSFNHSIPGKMDNQKELIADNTIRFLKLILKGAGYLNPLTWNGRIQAAIEARNVEQVGKTALEMLKAEVKKVVDLNRDTQIMTYAEKYRLQFLKASLTYAWFDMLKGKFRFKPQPDNLFYQFAEKYSEMVQDGLIPQLVKAEELADFKRLSRVGFGRNLDKTAPIYKYSLRADPDAEMVGLDRDEPPMKLRNGIFIPKWCEAVLLGKKEDF